MSHVEGHFQLPFPNRAAAGARIRPWSQRAVVLGVSAVVRHIRLTMKTATVRDLRNRFSRIAEWIEQGQQVEITRAGKVFARLVPAPPPKPHCFRMPDIMARLDQTFAGSSYEPADLARGLDASRGGPLGRACPEISFLYGIYQRATFGAKEFLTFDERHRRLATTCRARGQTMSPCCGGLQTRPC